jgi:flagellar motor switch protein FliN/FliY
MATGTGKPASGDPNIDRVLDITLVATARLGRVEMSIGDILNLGPGSIIDVGRMIDEPVDLLVNEKLIARGDVVVIEEKFGIRITEIITPEQRIETLR